MSRTLLQPVGQKRLTNVAVVRVRKHGNRFEIACFKNKVLSWRSRVEKDIDEVLQTHTVFSNVSKGILAKSKELIQAFGTDDEEKICLEILEKGELQVADKEREAQLSSQFRDIATIVMHKTINPDTERPYTISMIERLMREVHFAVDPHKGSKQQALELIRELERHFPINRARMKLQLTVAIHNKAALVGLLQAWNSFIETKEEANGFFGVVCQMEPGHFRECDVAVRDLDGRLEVVSMAVQKDGDGTVEEFNDEHEYNPNNSAVSRFGRKEVVEDVDTLSHTLMSQTWVIREEPVGSSSHNNVVDGRTKQDMAKPGATVKQHRCNTCNAGVGDAKQYRDHFKTEWHKHNLKRKTMKLAPLSPEECLADTDVVEVVSDINEYSR